MPVAACGTPVALCPLERSMREFLLKMFTWWSGTTFGTNRWTRLYGEKVGTDEFGNTYYRTRGGAIDPMLGFERRWVVYAGEAEASAIPPGWHGWMHHKTDTPPPAEGYVARPWELPHKLNLTGTPRAYRPQGSILNEDPQRPPATGDYQPWTPRA